MFLSQRLQTMGESATLKMAQLARERAAQGHQVINLSLGEPDFDTPLPIKQAATQALQAGYTKYTPVVGLLELRQALGQKLKRDNQLDYNTDQIIVSNGAKQSFANLCMALLNPGDEVIVFSPYWVSYAEIIGLTGAIPRFVYAGVEQDFKVQPQQVLDALNEKTRLIVFSSPCNPTGSVFSKAELQALAQALAQAPEQNWLLVSDEIYEYINFTSEGHFSIAACPEVAEKTVVINGFSKGYAMTGWRLGYLAGPTWVVQACAKMQGQFTSGAASFSQKAAAQALSLPLTEVETMRSAFMRRRDLVVERFGQIPGFKVNKPQGAFYLFPDVSALLGRNFGGRLITNAQDLAFYLLEQANVATVSGQAFGADHCLRLSYATSETLLLQAAQNIEQALSLT